MRNDCIEVINLLSGRNRCLERVLRLSSGFLGKARAGELNGIEEFHAGRRKFFRILELHDRKLDELIGGLPRAARDPEQLAAMERELRRRERLTREIMDCDADIMSCISLEKARIAETLVTTRKSQAAISRFKSAWVGGSGEELDQTL